MADTYKVTGQHQVTTLTPTGAGVPALEVSYETVPTGVHASVTIPLSQVTPEAVDAAIRAAADTHERIANL